MQFRIKDKERGDSDWYDIKQTFVRIPQIESVKCTTEMNNQCELRGEGLDYIAQVSVDGGRSWSPQNGAALQVEPTEAGNLKMMIPFLINAKFLQIKLRDFPQTEGLPVTNFTYANSVKKIKDEIKKAQNPNQPINANGNQPINQTSNQPITNGNLNNPSPATKTKTPLKGSGKNKKRN